MSDATGHSTPTGKIIDTGAPLVKLEKNIEVATEMYPGRLVAKGTTDRDVKIADGANLVPIGWLLYEEESPEFKKDAITTIYAINDKVKVGRGGEFCIYAWMPKGFVARQGDRMFSWGNGYVAPGAWLDGLPAVAIPFSKNTSEKNTSVVLATGAVVKDCRVLCETAVASSYIDIGILSSESGGATNGFLDGESCVTAGIVAHNLVDATAANITIGAFLVESDIQSDAAGVYTSIMNQKTCDGTAKTISYVTSSHDIAGRFFLCMNSPGIIEVGVAEESLDASGAEARIWVRNTL